MNEKKKQKRLDTLVQLFQEQQKMIDARTKNVDKLINQKHYNVGKLKIDVNHETLENVRLTNMYDETKTNIEKQIEISQKYSQ